MILEAGEYEIIKVKGEERTPKYEPWENDPRRLRKIENIEVNLTLNEEDGRTLGLSLDEKEKQLKASHFVGVVRLTDSEKDEVIFQVKPKVANASPIKMLIKVLSHPVVSSHVEFEKMYKVMTDQKPIPSDMVRVSPEYILFLVLHYFKVLNDLIKRGLQKGYSRTEENLRGKIKGRILVSKNLKKNFLRARYHHSYCLFNRYTEDILENRILKAAFLKGKNYVSSLSKGILQGNIKHWVGLTSLNFERVSTVHIYPTDFRLVTVQRIRRDYSLALGLAEKILRLLGYDPEIPSGIHIKDVYPYWIDMNELFERYCEALIRDGKIKEFVGYRVYPGYQDKDIKVDPLANTEKSILRPDFILVNPANGDFIIADAKYKQNYNNKKWLKEDLQQLSLYGRICPSRIKKHIKENFGEEINIDEKEPDLYILYPTDGTEIKPAKAAKSFRGIYKIGLPLIKG